MFKTFALVFFVVRVVLPPLSMVVPGLVYGRVMPLKTYLITNALMASIYALQLMWCARLSQERPSLLFAAAAAGGAVLALQLAPRTAWPLHPRPAAAACHLHNN